MEKARLVLAKKGKDKPANDPSNYRPLCMLDTCGKVLERLVLGRLDKHLDEDPRGRANNV